jgi:trimeric autotransporter adhesin
VAVTRARWLVAALIGVASLIVSGQALLVYLAQRLLVGVVAIVVLVGVTAIGFASLVRARRYLARELFALGAEPPSGALYQGRRAQLLVLRQRGVSPDLDVLGDATAAAEAERGYTGRYLVATTVLIGLVGTFGGLMETLAPAAPLLKGDLASGAGGPTAALALIAGPLAGLHVTFGTSVVAILVTIALTLVQGDVTLQQERLLALLQERTRHVLVPELWAADDSVGERTVRALLELRAFVAESLTTSAATNAERIAGVVRVEVQRLVAQTRADAQAATTAQTAALERTGVVLTEGFRRTTETVAEELRGVAVASRDAMTAAATASREAVAEAASSAREVVGLAAASSGEAFAAASTATREQMATAVATLASTTARTLESIATTTQAAVTSLGELRGSLGAQLEGASQALSTAAAELRGAVGALSPTLAELAPQLGGLSAEIALLAARADSPELPNAVLDELVRLSEDVERLLASSQPATAATEAAARETGS